MNTYKSLTCNLQHVYTCCFTNGFEVQTKDNKIISQLIKGEITFEYAATIQGVLIYPPLPSWEEVSKQIEKSDSDWCNSLEQNSVPNRKVTELEEK